MSTNNTAPLEGNDDAYQKTSDNQPDWLAIARAAYDSSTDYLNVNHRKQFEKNLSNFQNKHPAGSKYYKSVYKNRSRLFRPKTRMAIRKNEATFASALFSANDVVKVSAEDSDDLQKRRDAHFWDHVLNYRLTKTIPWFQISTGAFQESQVYGVVVSKQYWEYEEGESEKRYSYDSQTGMPVLGEDAQPVTEAQIKVVKDQPKIRLLEIENVRFDPACDWTDPVNSSPYFIECMPMYVGDILDRMNQADEKTGQPEWTPLSKEQIIAYAKDTEQTDDTLSKERAEAAKVEADHEVSEFEIAWVHENIVRWGGEDYVYYTLSTKFMLSGPKPLKDVYKHGIRPFQIGVCVLEAHKPIPSGIAELGQGLQAEANDTVNQRLDNVKYVLNKRKLVQRNSGVDLQSLLRSVPGGITLTDDVNAIRDDEVNDVTSSAYAEQNRIDTDFDDITGTFSHGSVANNRQLNETVGGMQIMSQASNADTEYLIRTFVETWVEPVLRQLVLLEQYYEDDQHIIDVATRTADKKISKEQQPGQMPQQELPLKEPQHVDVKVNVGFGSLDPNKRMQKIIQGVQALAALVPWMAGKVNTEELSKEIFGALGFKNGDRFFTDFQPPQQQQDPKTQFEMKKLQVQEQESQQNMQLEEAKLQQKAQYDQAKLKTDYDLGMAKLALQENLTTQQLKSKLGMDQQKMQHDKEITGARNMTELAKIEQQDRELKFKAQTGRQGI